MLRCITVFLLGSLASSLASANTYYCPKLPLTTTIGDTIEKNWRVGLMRNVPKNNLYRLYLKWKKLPYTLTGWFGFEYIHDPDDENSSYQISCCSHVKNQDYPLCVYRTVKASECETRFGKNQKARYVCDESIYSDPEPSPFGGYIKKRDPNKPYKILFTCPTFSKEMKENDIIDNKWKIHIKPVSYNPKRPWSKSTDLYAETSKGEDANKTWKVECCTREKYAIHATCATTKVVAKDCEQLDKTINGRQFGCD